MFFSFCGKSSEEKKWADFVKSALFSQRRRTRKEKVLLANYSSTNVLLEILPSFFSTDRVSLSYDTTPLEKIGGDLLDFEWIDKHTISFYLFDIAGHDESSGEIALALRQLLTRLSPSTFKHPQKILNSLNREIVKQDNDFLFVTMWCGVLNLQTKKLTFSSAGSPPALWVPADETKEPKGFKKKSLPLGLDKNFKYKEESFYLYENGCLYLMSDGAYEIELAKTGHYLSWEGLKKFMTTKDYLTPHGRMPSPSEFKNLLTSLAKEQRLLDDFSLMKISLNLFPKESHP